MKSIFLRVLALCLVLVVISAACGVCEYPDRFLGSPASEGEEYAPAASVRMSSGKDVGAGDFEWEVLAIANSIRIKNGLEPLSTFSLLQKACDIREDEIVKEQSHDRPDGRPWSSVIRDLEIPYSFIAENLAFGYPTPKEVMEGWMNSPGHRGNLLSDTNHMGVGYKKTGSGYRYFWVQLFARSSYEEITSVTLSGADDVAVKRGTKISDMGITVFEENSVYGTCACPLIDEMCTGYDPQKMGLQTVTAQYRGHTITFDVNVVDPVTDIKLNKKSASLRVGKTLQLKAELLPKTAPVRTVEWTSSDEEVATVDENGLVTAVSRGKATITARAHSGVKATCDVNVTVKKITSIKLDRTKYTVTLKKGDSLGDTFRLKATIKPASATEKTLKWKSSDEDVAVVDAEGNVTIVGFGKCTITAKATDGSKKSAKCVITVKQQMVKSIKLTGEKKMRVGDIQTLDVVIKPKKAFDQRLRWKSSNPAAVTVDENGLVTAVAPGKANIVCSALDGSKVKFRFKITVSK